MKCKMRTLALVPAFDDRVMCNFPLAGSPFWCPVFLVICRYQKKGVLSYHAVMGFQGGPNRFLDFGAKNLPHLWIVQPKKTWAF